MLHVALYQPEIPPNTGNIIRLCANTATKLHLIGPLGFTWEDKHLKRAGLDYDEFASVAHYQDSASFLASQSQRRIIACSTKGRMTHSHIAYRDDDILLFGPETRGLPRALRQCGAVDAVARIPMVAESRSLNLSNAVAVMLYEALRQLGFPDMH